MNLRKIKNISQDADLAPVIVINSSINTDKSKANNIFSQKNNYSNYICITNYEDENQLNPEKLGVIFTTEAPTKSITNHNSINTSSYHPYHNNFKKEKLFFDTKNLCKEMYKKKPSELNDKKIFLYEKMNQGLNYTIKDLRKDPLPPKKKNYTRKKLITSFDFGNLQHYQKKNEQNVKTGYNINDYLQHYYDEFKPKMNTKNILYENYAQNFKIYKHNQIYNLRKNFLFDNKLPPIERTRSNGIKNFIGLIPERIQDSNETKKKCYSIYRTIKDNKKERFII